MATVRDIVTRAYRKIGVVASDEPMTPDQASAGLDAFNDMVHGWDVFGVRLGAIDLDLNSPFPLEPRFREGTVYQLAARLAPDHAVAAPDPDAFFRALQAAYLVIPSACLPGSILSRRASCLGQGAQPGFPDLNVTLPDPNVTLLADDDGSLLAED